MYKQFCDRCGRLTKNKYAFLLPETNEVMGSYTLNGTWFGSNGIVLCNNCIKDFDNFRYNHEHYNTVFDEEEL